MVPFPSEYSTYTSASGPQAPFGTPAPGEPAHKSSHFNDILQKLTTPSASKSGAASAAAEEATSSSGASNADGSPAGVDSAVVKNSGGRGKSGEKSAPVQASGKDSNDKLSGPASAVAATTLVTPPVTVLTPRARAAWSTASNAPQEPNPSPESNAAAAATENAADGAIAASVTSSIPARVQGAVQAQPANANSKSPKPNQIVVNALVTAVAGEPTLVRTPAARTFASPNASSTTTVQSADSNDPSASAPSLAAMTAVVSAPLPQPVPVPAPALNASTSVSGDETGASTAIDVLSAQAKTAGQNRQTLAARAQLAAAALPQTAGAPSLEEDPASENGTPSLGPAGADAALASDLRVAAATAAASGAHVNAPAPTATNTTGPAPVPSFQINAAQVANATVTSSAAVKAATSAPIAAPAASSSAAARPAPTVAIPDLVGAGLARAMSPIQIDTPAPLPADVDASAVMSQIVQAMRVQLAQGGGTAEVTLQPGYLGGVTLNVKVDQDSVTASVVADTPAVREALRTQEPALRDALTSQGLRLDHFDVAAPSETPRKNPGGGNGSSAQDQRQPRQQKRRDPSEPAFEFIA